ncbi:MAG: hypothetical protein IJI71_03115 [Clostridia bacterium]|nr:hypothetical protein [Clostridia bacterium]
MRYRCEDCGHVFDADEARKYYEPDTGWRELQCPSCRSPELVEVRECKFCGEDEDAYRLTSDGYCRACVRKTREKFNAFLDKHFEKEELEILKDQWDIYPIDD